MQESVTIIIVVLIVAILADGVRRMRIAQRDKIRMSRSIYKNKSSKEEPAKDYTSELPNGGARVVAHRDPAKAQQRATKKDTASQRRAAKQAHLKPNEPVPLLMESVVEDVLLKDEKNPAHNQQLSDNMRIEPTFSANERVTDNYSSSRETDDIADINSPAGVDAGYPDNNPDNIDDRTAYVDDPYDEEPYEDEVLDDDYEDDGYDEEAGEYDEDDYDDDIHDDDDYDGDHDEESAANPVTGEQLQNEPEEVLIINIMAFKGEMFYGQDLLDAVLKCGMRYGDMNIFHRYSDSKGEGALLFSMANMVKPGTFDLDTMDQFETPGVSLFMTLPLNADSMQSFDLMAETANSIAEALDGELKDEQRSVMTRQTIEHCRQRIRDFELKRLSRSRH